MTAIQKTFTISEAVYSDARADALSLAAEQPSQSTNYWPPVALGAVAVVEAAFDRIVATVLRVFRGAIMREDGSRVSDALLVAVARAEEYTQWMRACVDADIKSSGERIEKLNGIHVDRLLLWPDARALGNLEAADLLATGVDLEASAHAVPAELVWAMIELHDALVWAVDALVRSRDAAMETNVLSASALKSSIVRDSLQSIEFSSRAQEHIALASFRRHQRKLTDEASAAALRRLRWSLRTESKPRISFAQGRRT